jgi:hypothetical protein
MPVMVVLAASGRFSSSMIGSVYCFKRAVAEFYSIHGG